MSSTVDKNEKRVGIFRKRDLSLKANTTTEQLRTTCTRTKVQEVRNTSPRSVDGGPVSYLKKPKFFLRKPAVLPVACQRNSLSTFPSTSSLKLNQSAHNTSNAPPKRRDNKSIIGFQVQYNKKQLHQIQKELNAVQNKAIALHRRYKESMSRQSKMTGIKEKASSLDDLKIVCFQHSEAGTDSKLIPGTKLSGTTDNQHVKLLHTFGHKLTEIYSQMHAKDDVARQIHNLIEEAKSKIYIEQFEQTERKEKCKHENVSKIADMESKMKELELKKIHEENKNIVLIKTIAANEKKIELLMNKLKLLEQKSTELKVREKTNNDLKMNVASLQDKLLKSIGDNENTEKKMTRMADDLKMQVKEFEVKYLNEAKICDELQQEIGELKSNLAQTQEMEYTNIVDENLKLQNNTRALMDEVKSLKEKLNELHEQRNSEVEKLKQIINKMIDDVNTKDKELAKKSSEIKHLEEAAKNSHEADIENLRADLTKAHAELQEQEESLCMQQRLLKLRSDMIQSLQDDDDISKTRIAELSTEVQIKSTIVNQLNQEILAKTEELQNLFSSLAAKNLEVKRQDQMIKMMDETIKRNKKICVTQQQKISQLENENLDLKRYVHDTSNDSL